MKDPQQHPPIARWESKQGDGILGIDKREKRGTTDRRFLLFNKDNWDPNPTVDN